MKCPFCAGDSKVVDKRDNEGVVRRRRECLACARRFTTYEQAELNLTVIKKSGEKEAFSREKIINGLLKACEKRPVTREAIETITDKIEITALKAGGVLATAEIGDAVMRELKKLDEVAYIRFVSVYRSFDDARSFEKEVKLLKV